MLFVDKINLFCSVLWMCTSVAGLFSYYTLAAQTLPQSKTEEQLKLEEMEAKTPKAAESSLSAGTDTAALITLLPEDTTPRFSIRQIRIIGNTLISADTLMSKLPDVYDASSKEAVGTFLYDLRPLKSIVELPETPVEVTARSIQGFTQYLLGLYQKCGFAGIYIYVPSDAFEPGKELSQGILPIRILEAPVSSVGSSYYNVNNLPAEKYYLKPELLLEWSPLVPGKVANRHAMDEYLNLLNRNPDRYVSAVVSQGKEPNSLDIEYRVYEANPWHFFVQLDNAGTRDVRWTPRFGLVNTNLLGHDDRLTVIWQTTPDSSWLDEYAVYGSYEFPVFSPRFRLNLFGGHNEFDIAGAGDISFLGRGTFAGGTLRYNLFQTDKWFFDLTGTLTHDESKVTPSLFPEFLTSDIHVTMWGWGAQLYRTDDMTDTLFSVSRLSTLDGSHQSKFGLARTNANRDAALYNITARRSQYLDISKIQRLSAAFQWIIPNKRLAPVKMTSFGGMYSVRGYDEFEIIADGGILASLQYEYDIIRKVRVDEYAGGKVNNAPHKPFIRKIAPLAFIDYGQARIEDPLPSEHRDRELASVGCGAIVELGDNFTGTVYYGYPLIASEDTRSGKGRLNAGFLFRW
jgi:hemolysin activation/secretion protein